ncbi:hypothetical protein ACFX14_037669 [Malus domestica]
MKPVDQRLAVASDLEQNFEANKAQLTDFATGARQIQHLQLNRRMRQAKVTIGEVRWLELKATLEAFLLPTP